MKFRHDIDARDGAFTVSCRPFVSFGKIVYSGDGSHLTNYFMLRLPSFRMMPSAWTDEPRWHRLTWVWLFDRGGTFEWLEEP